MKKNICVHETSQPTSYVLLCVSNLLLSCRAMIWDSKSNNQTVLVNTFCLRVVCQWLFLEKSEDLRKLTRNMESKCTKMSCWALLNTLFYTILFEAYSKLACSVEEVTWNTNFNCRLKWSEVIEPASKLAKEGFTVTEHTGGCWNLLVNLGHYACMY